MSIILIGINNTCFCTAASKCILGKMGSVSKCDKHKLNLAGYQTISVADAKSDNEVSKSLIIDGREHVLKIKETAIK